MEIHGTCKEGFEAVRDAFEQNFAEDLEVGAAAAVTVDGESVVDIWAGDAGPNGEPWERDTIVNVYSTTKTMAATCMLALADRGELDFDAPVCQYWPEFAQNGKEGVLVRHVMSHTAGLPGYVPPVTAADLYDLDAIAECLAAQELWWEPGTKSGYHAVTQGNLEGEILYRITGERMADWFRDEIAEPLGADFHMSLPASEDHRMGELLPPEVLSEGLEINGVKVELDSICARTLMSCLLDATEPRTREWRAAEIPAAGGIGNARSIARIHSMLACGGEVDGVRIMSEAGARKGLEEQIDNVDDVLYMRLRHGIGFARELEGWVSSPNPNHMFWGGWGGSVAVVDFDVRASVSYVMNKMDAAITGDPRGGRIVDSAFASIAAAG
ncbi:serine hydrolase domain-containing protein [Candidatus Poriferisodalis sp.]|uniref:serine hydrolase domain-containing protein n=1 Tax=Candidatus Poriferisodalis sp. TaxID=3101277 RepID=UPI003C6FECB7